MTTLPGFVIDGHGGNRSGIEPEKRFYTSFSWEIVSFGDKIPYIFQRNNGLELLRTATLPNITFEKVEATGGTVRYKYAGNPAFEDIRISWYDSRGMANVYKAWMNTIYTNKTGVKPPNEYKSNAVLRKYLADRPNFEPEPEDSGNVTYTIFGSWPVAFKESELTYLEATIKSVEVTITYDYFDMESTNE